MSYAANFLGRAKRIHGKNALFRKFAGLPEVPVSYTTVALPKSKKPGVVSMVEPTPELVVASTPYKKPLIVPTYSESTSKPVVVNTNSTLNTAVDDLKEKAKDVVGREFVDDVSRGDMLAGNMPKIPTEYYLLAVVVLLLIFFKMKK